ncbi:MAG TPA: hypothetical protein VGM07_15735 [Stellaceae bacterium]|jgi:hypothetical protein
MIEPSTTGRAAPVRSLALRRAFAGSLGFIAFVIACGLAIPSPVAAADGATPQIIHLTGSSETIEPDLKLLCPQGGATQPRFENVTTGKIFAIYDPKLEAVAEKACGSSLAAPESSNVQILNTTGKLLLVGFAPQAGAKITWGAGCGTPIKGTSVILPVNGNCRAMVTDSVANPGSRFCAAIVSVASSGASSSGALDCSKAQQQNRTLIEPYFQPGPCVGYNASCIWYDISVIPANCTDADWSSNYCANTGGAAYNLPVTLSCAGALPEPTYICKGPAGSKYGSAKYPGNCGNPNASYRPGPSGSPTALNAYFYPDDNSYGQPNAVCPNGQALTITFLPGL